MSEQTKEILYSRVSAENKEYLYRMALSTDRSLNYIVETIMDAVRTGRKPKFKTKPIEVKSTAKDFLEKRLKVVKKKTSKRNGKRTIKT